MSETQESSADDAAQHEATAEPYHRPVDQVVRHMNFSAAHPEVGIVFYPEAGRWEATVPGRRKMLSTELRRLLDRLEDHFR